MKELTRAEEQVMQILWKVQSGFVRDLILHFPEPRPAYNTISTIIRILEKKGFVGHRAYGKSHEYYSKISKGDYSRFHVGRMVKNYFEGSPEKLVSFFAREEKLGISELEEILKLLKQTQKEKK